MARDKTERMASRVASRHLGAAFHRVTTVFDDGDGYVQVEFASVATTQVTFLSNVNQEGTELLKAMAKLHGVLGLGTRPDMKDVEMGGAHKGAFELRVSDMWGKEHGEDPSPVWPFGGGGQRSISWEDFIKAVKSLGWGSYQGP